MLSNSIDHKNISLNIEINPILSNENEVKNTSLDFVFEIFKQFSLDPLNELYGRAYWCEKDPRESLKYYYINDSKSGEVEISPGCFAKVIGDADFINTKCGVTYKGLMSALTGKNFEELGKLNSIETNSNLDSLTSQILENGLKLKSESGNDFFFYGFSLASAPMHTVDLTGSSNYSGHKFVVIQYLDEKREIRYRFFQSFVIAYTLNEYLTKYKNDYSQEEFIKFLEDLNKITSLTEWTEEMTKFHKEYFHVEKNDLRWVMPSGIPFEVKWQKTCVADVIIQKIHYEIFKSSSFFPSSFIK